MTWQKREVSANLVVLGDAEGNAKGAAGLLASVTKDPRYPDNRRYEIVQQNGESKSVAGSASINSQLGVDDVGKFVKLTFQGWGSSGNGKYKIIDVEVWDGDVKPEMKAWPRYAEFHDNGAVKAKDTRTAAVVEDDPDSDLPF